MTDRPGLAPKNETSNLDVLRAIGVLVVFFFHLGIAVTSSHALMIWGIDLDPFGRCALFLFFVHTSFVLMQSMERAERAGNNVVSSFVVRRSFRIYPLSIICVLSVLLLHVPRSFRSGPFEFPAWGAVISNLLLSQNLTHDASITLPLWSLPYEVQMYALLPFVYLSTRVSKSIRGPMIWFAAAVIAAPAICFFFHSYRAGYILQFLPACMAGVIANKLISKRPVRRFPSWSWPLFIVGLMVLYGAAVNAQHVSIWAFSYRGFLTASLTSLILGFMLPRFNHATNRAVVAITGWIAQHSYGIYLTHMSVMWISFVALAGLATPIRWSVFAVLSVMLPMACLRYVENPMIKLGKRLSRPAQVTARQAAA